MTKQRSNASKQRGINQDLNNVEHAEKKDFEKSSRRSKAKRKAPTKNGFKPRSKAYRDSDEKLAKYGNDPSWYALNPQLLRDAAQLSFNNPIGLGLYKAFADNGEVSDAGRTSAPGLMAIYYIPIFGVSKDNSSAVNLAARRFYTFIRHANSGSANYDSPDLMLYLLSVDNAFAFYTHLCRIYGIANVYSQKNRYLPDALLEACGVNPKLIREELADFRYGLNVRAAKLNSLAVPASFAIFKRHAWLNSMIFTDADLEKAQCYMHVPAGYYIYKEGPTSTGVNQLQYKSLFINGDQLTLRTPSQLLGILDEMIDPLLQSEDMGIMAGDILKAYGNENLLGVPSIPEEYVVLPTYLEEYLIQVQNATTCEIIGDHATWENFNVTQSPTTGAILFKPSSQLSAAYAHSYDYISDSRLHLMTLRTNSPTPEDIMLASRMMTSMNVIPSSDGAADVDLSNAGTEIISHIRITSGYNQAAALGQRTWWSSRLKSGLTFDQLGRGVLNYSILEKFDWHPAVNVAGTTETEAVFQDWDNVTTLSSDVLRKMNETALLSLFDVPSISGFKA